MTGPTLVILAAGMGRRFGGDKQLTPVGPGGETILELNAIDAAAAGFGGLVVVTRPELEIDLEADLRLRARPEYPEGRVTVAVQRVPRGRSKPWGTADAVLCARDAVDGPFAVCNADDLYGRGAFAVVAAHLTQRADEAAVVGYPVEETLSAHGAVSRAVLEHDDDRLLLQVTETRLDRATARPGTLVSMNLWGFPLDAIGLLERATAVAIQGGAEEAFLPTIVNDLVRHDDLVVRVLPTTERWIGMTYAEDAEAVRAALRARG